MMRTSGILVLALLALFGAGCAGQDKPAGYEKKNFEKTAPPAEYRGPGQPGGPQSGPVGGTPPATGGN